MLHTTNIPLAHPSYRRTFPWRMFVFALSGIALGICGWILALIVHIGGRPLHDNEEGLRVSLRTTPPVVAWLSAHARGIPLSETCPIDAPTLVHLAHPTRITLTSTEQATTLHLAGNTLESSSLRAWEAMYECAPTWDAPRLGAFPTLHTLSIASANVRVQGKLTAQGLALTNTTSFTNDVARPTAFLARNEVTSWPSVTNLVLSLPGEILAQKNLSLPVQWFAQYTNPNEYPTALFAWQSENELAWGMSFAQTLTDEDILALAYTYSNVTPQNLVVTRADGSRYTAQHAPRLSLTEKSPGGTQTVIDESAQPVAWITCTPSGETLFSTKDIQWNAQRPSWSLNMRALYNATQRTQHTPRTWFTALTSYTVNAQMQFFSWD